ncbi:MAG: DUF4870 domain-containing protein [Chloroflexi bacterium]|nr:DUF4870 domain-containing protein [Chloroflexota bacterium]
MDANVAGVLCYVLGWVSGIVFLILEKENRFVRFHAMQSIITFGGLTVISMITWALAQIPFIGVLFFIVGICEGILAFILWIVLIVKASQGETYKLPTVGDIADSRI